MPDVTDLNYPFTISRVNVTRGSRNQTTGAWVGETETETTITGNFSPSPLVDEFRGKLDQYEEGEARLFTNDTLKIGDRVKVHLDDSGTNFQTYRVESIIDNYGVIKSLASTLGSISAEDGRTEYKIILQGD